MLNWDQILSYIPYIKKLARNYNMEGSDFAEELICDLADNITKFDESRGSFATFIYWRSRRIRSRILSESSHAAFTYISDDIEGVFIENLSSPESCSADDLVLCSQVLSSCNQIEREALLSLMYDFTERELFEFLNTNRKTRNKRIERFRNRYLKEL
jgi:DNA-directed RNA polymerase specialized sigma24 family protein